MASYDDQKDTHLGQLNVVDSREHDKVIDSKRVDEALTFLDHTHDVTEGEISEVDDKKLMRKVDWTLMPLMFACYFLQYSDKTLSQYPWARCAVKMLMDICSVLCEYHGNYQGHQHAAQWILSFGYRLLCRMSVPIFRHRPVKR